MILILLEIIERFDVYESYSVPNPEYEKNTISGPSSLSTKYLFNA